MGAIDGGEVVDQPPSELLEMYEPVEFPRSTEVASDELGRTAASLSG